MEKNKKWKKEEMERFRPPEALYWMVVLLLSQQLMLSSALNEDGKALLRFKGMVEIDPFGSLLSWDDGSEEEKDTSGPCSWFGVECHNGRVVSLNLEDFCLKGTLSPELGKLSHLRYLSLNNNSFYGFIPNEIGELKDLQVLDVGYNNFLGSLKLVIDNLSSLEVLVLSRNQIPSVLSPELSRTNLLPKIEISDDLHALHVKSITRNVGHAAIRRFLRRKVLSEEPHSTVVYPNISLSPVSFPKSPQRPNPRGESLSSSPAPSKEATSPTTFSSPAPSNPVSNTSNISPAPSDPVSNTSNTANKNLSKKNTGNKSTRTLIIILVSVGIGIFVLAVILFVYFGTKKDAVVKPWATGLSGQLQKAFVTGVPILKLSEIQAACEDFSNVIDTLEDYIIYKGTLSSGVEIAVTSVVAKSTGWSKSSETQFRKKIATLSKVNHKNFVNLLGYCKQEKPFTRMMVFEYAPNGTLYDHIHVKEAKDLGWAARVRIAMGIAYCLEHMCQLDPPFVLETLNSKSILLTDDYAAKISDIRLWSKEVDENVSSSKSGLLTNQSSNLEMVVYKYGLLLLEMVSGRLSHSEEIDVHLTWASGYLNGEQPLKHMLDPMLEGLGENDLTGIIGVICSCLNPDLNQRPSMKDVAARLREITSVNPEGATPKLSPLWWAELEIISTE